MREPGGGGGGGAAVSEQAGSVHLGVDALEPRSRGRSWGLAQVALGLAGVGWQLAAGLLAAFIWPPWVDGTYWSSFDPISVEDARRNMAYAIGVLVFGSVVAGVHLWAVVVSLRARGSWALAVAGGSYIVAAVILGCWAAGDSVSALPVYTAIALVVGTTCLWSWRRSRSSPRRSPDRQR